MDYEASYRFAMDDVVPWGLGGDVTLRLLATNVTKFITNPGFNGGVIVESAGTNNGNTPHWKTFFTQAYDTDSWGFFVNERWFSEGVINRNWVACASACPAPVDANHPTVNSNYMPGELYFDVGGTLRPVGTFLALFQDRQPDQPEPGQCLWLRSGEPGRRAPIRRSTMCWAGSTIIGFRITD